MLWLDDVDPNPPEELSVKASDNCVVVSWKAPAKASDGQNAYGYVIYRFAEGEEIKISQPKNILKISFDAKQTSFSDFSVLPDSRYTYVVTALDRLKNESLDTTKAGIKTGLAVQTVSSPATGK